MSLSQPPSSGKKASHKKPVPKWQSWENQALDRRFYVIAGLLSVFGVALLGTIGYLLFKGSAERRTTVEARPTVVDVRPPEFLQPIVCDVTAGFQSGGLQQFLKNIGNARATDVVPSVKLRLVPERKLGSPEFDNIPSGECRDRPYGVPPISPLAAGAEASPRLPQPLLTMPPILIGEPVQLYGVSCVTYADASGADHESCNTYRFRPTTGNPVFMCDGTPKTGKFDTASIMNCVN